VKIGELSRRTAIPTRMLRYYEEQGLLRPDRAENGYRSYPESAIGLTLQIRGLLDSGLTSQIIRNILPCLDDPADVRLTARCLPPETVALIRGELDRVQQRIDCLTRNRDAIQAYLSPPALTPPA
jgi:DNA-binding transcriptional MerR regulator